MSPTTIIIVDIVFVTALCMVIGFALTLAVSGQWSRKSIWRGILIGLIVEATIIAVVVLWTLVIAAPVLTLVIFWIIKTRQRGKERSV